jgi:hypothetical protein
LRSAKDILYIALAMQNSKDFTRFGVGPVDDEVSVDWPEKNVFASGEVITPVADVRVSSKPAASIPNFLPNLHRSFDAVTNNEGPKYL